jgi:hypothetical protein
MNKTFSLQLIAVMTRSRPLPDYSVFKRLSLNSTADGVEATVQFRSDEEDEPQKYRVTVVPCRGKKGV